MYMEICFNDNNNRVRLGSKIKETILKLNKFNSVIKQAAVIVL